MPQIGVSLSDATIAALDAEAAATGRSRSYVAASRIENVSELACVTRTMLKFAQLLDECDMPSRLIGSVRAALAPFETGAATGDEQ